MKDRTRNGIMLIIRPPKGEAPLEIRTKWIGVEIQFLKLDNLDMMFGVLTGTPRKPEMGFTVWQTDAIDALREISPEAADWWNKMGYPKIQGQFIFNADCAEIVG